MTGQKDNKDTNNKKAEPLNRWPGNRWVAFYTAPRAEKQVAALMNREGYSYYLPLVRERHQWSDRMKWVEKPLIPSYIFARINQRQLEPVHRLDGVVCPVTVGHTHQVAFLKDGQMEDFRFMVEHQQELKVLDAGEFHKGATVEVVSGDFKGKRGRLVSQEGKDMFCILLEGVSLAIAATFNAELLKVIKE